MKILKILGLIVIVIAVLIGIATVAAPSEVHFSRSTLINAPSKIIYQDLLIFKNFNSWSPWADKDPNIKWEYYGPTLGTGAGMKWISEDPQVGNGEMSIENANYPNSITYLMDFGYSKANAAVIINESENGTEVTWTYDEEGLSGLYKLMSLMTESFVGPDYEKGLTQLKTRMESAPSTSWDMEIMISSARSYIGTRDTLEAPIGMIATKMAQSFGEILRYAGNNGIEQDGQPITVYLEAGEIFKFIPGIPMTTEEVSEESLMLRYTPDGYELRASFYGTYEAMEPAYIEMENLISFYNMESAGVPWEEYITDPGVESNPENWLTYIHWPIQYKE